jgi:type I restriction enzyme S subunit
MKQYPNYKPSDVEWIDNIPIHWDKTTLKYTGFLYGGITGKSGDDFNNEDKPDNKRFIPFTNILGNTYIIQDDYGTVSISDNENQNKVKQYDLFFLMSSETQEDVGKSSVLKDDIGELYLNSFCKGFRLIDERIYPLFLNYLLSGHCYRKQLSIGGNGFTRINLRLDKVKDFLFYYPTLPEQHQIVEFLDEKTSIIDDLIQKKQRKIELLKEQRTSIINHIVTKGLNPNVKMKDSGVEWIGEIPEHWELKRLNTLGRFSKGGGIRKDEILPSGLPCIRYGEIYTHYDRIVFSTISFISEESSRNCESIKKGDVLFTGSGETIEDIGKSVVYYGDSDVFVGGDIIILRLNQGLDPIFISYLMNCHYVIYQKSLSGKGEIVVHIYSKQLKDIMISIPPLIEQYQIAQYLDQKTNEIDTTITLENKKIDLLKEYRQSLISEVVTGKIDVRKN